ncbi:flagellar biosynthesis protein FlgA [Chelatococcus sp. SYSU_G07232]|uniref:Flagellar biosynthesis protein FlgA n=1 Tax=Chelatococcus albus TaxID=3047466 RepID=A0ABT7AH14_9HYPH|nr:flagellar biosynthesis protein FlgA [Chelatococcus sp. SYSU_G07232]MDJ1158660.1 flagellar biosynthesis protein FlgA [Chelatococcus sp. SYSU_G07232]
MTVPSLRTACPANAAHSVALVGAGEFGATFAAQVRRIPSLALRLVCDRDRTRALGALAAAGYGAEDVAACDGRPGILAALARGRIAVVEDFTLVADLPLDLVVEATGQPHAAAALADLALAAGYHTALATKEAEIVVGPILARKARSAGLVHTPVDGDQPSLLMRLFARARTLGLPVVTAGKSTESDYVYDPGAGTVSTWGRTVARPDYAPLFTGEADLAASLAARVVSGLDTATVPDLCEMGIVANHCGLAVDRAELHAPVARTVELARLFRPREEGGLLARKGVVDVFVCLRRPDEISFAGGVFVVVEAPDAATGRLLAAKGIPGDGEGRYLLLHNPVHLLGVEAPISVLSAVHDGRSTGGDEVRQRYDLVARAERDFAAGETLDMGARHALSGVAPLLVPARPLGPEAPVPYYLAAGARLRRPVGRGATFTLADVVVDEDSALMRLRREQDALDALREPRPSAV